MLYSDGVSNPAETVITVKSEIRGPVLALLGFWLLTAIVIALFAGHIWLVALACGGVVGACIALVWVLRPRRGDLLRLVVDTPRRTIWWMHQGHEPEEVPFAALRAILIEPLPARDYIQVWAIEKSGRRHTIGSGRRADLEIFGRRVAELAEAPLWFREEHPAGSESSASGEVADHPRRRES